MTRTYVFRWKRYFFWKKQIVTGHKLEEDQNKMVLILPDGGLEEIKDWNKCVVKLGADWVLVTKDSIQEEAGK